MTDKVWQIFANRNKEDLHRPFFSTEVDDPFAGTLHYIPEDIIEGAGMEIVSSSSVGDSDFDTWFDVYEIDTQTPARARFKYVVFMYAPSESIPEYILVQNTQTLLKFFQIFGDFVNHYVTDKWNEKYNYQEIFELKFDYLIGKMEF